MANLKTHGIALCLGRQMGMESGRRQLQFELRESQQCRSVRPPRKPSPARIWFEKMRQVLEGAAEQPASEVLKTPELPGVIKSGR